MNGKALSIFPLRIVYQYIDEGSPLQAGFSVSKKRFKKATDRNRIKRLLREAWRLNSVGLKESLKEQNLRMGVFLIYVGNDMPEFNGIQKQIMEVLKKLKVIRPGTDL